MLQSQYQGKKGFYREKNIRTINYNYLIFSDKNFKIFLFKKFPLIFPY